MSTREPAKRVETIRDDPDEHVRVEWHVGLPSSTFVTLSAGDDRILSLDTIELKQAVRALDETLDGDADSAVVRDLGAIEQFWFTESDGFVTLMSRTPTDNDCMVVFSADEARLLRATIEAAVDELEPEDHPYV